MLMLITDRDNSPTQIVKLLPLNHTVGMLAAPLTVLPLSIGLFSPLQNGILRLTTSGYFTAACSAQQQANERIGALRGEKSPNEGVSPYFTFLFVCY